MNPHASPEWVRLLITEANIKEYFEQIKLGLRPGEECQANALRLSILMAEMQRLKKLENNR